MTDITEHLSQGFANRRAYLESLCSEYPRAIVFALASVLPPSEDFDGLLTALEDAADDIYNQ